MRKVLFAVVVMVALAGCNADPGSRREIALMRAEIIELENRYAALQAGTGRAPDTFPGSIDSGFSGASRFSDYSPAQGRQRPGLFSRSRLAGGNGQLGFRQNPHNHVYLDDSGYCDECGELAETWSIPAASDGGVYDSPGMDNGYPAAPQYHPNQNPHPEPVQNPPLQQQSDPSPEIVPEEIDPEWPADSSGGTSMEQSSFNRDSSRQGTNRSAVPSGVVSATPQRPTAATSAADLVVLQTKTIGIDLNDDGIDEGLQVSFGLTDHEGYVVEEAAHVVISLLDPALPRGQQRLGLWEHTTDRKSPMLQARPADHPDQLVLHWQQQRPTHADLLLFVRHVRSDGTALEKSVPVRVRTGANDDFPDTDARSQEPASDDRTTSRSSEPAPEINIDLDQIDGPAGNQPRRRPAWKAIR